MLATPIMRFAEKAKGVIFLLIFACQISLFAGCTALPFLISDATSTSVSTIYSPFAENSGIVSSGKSHIAANGQIFLFSIEANRTQLNFDPYNYLLSYKIKETDSWSPSQIIYTSKEKISNLQMVDDINGTFHIIFQRSGESWQYLSNRTSNWQVETISSLGLAGIPANIQLNSQGDPYILEYTAPSSFNAQFHLHFRNITKISQLKVKTTYENSTIIDVNSTVLQNSSSNWTSMDYSFSTLFNISSADFFIENETMINIFFAATDIWNNSLETRYGVYNLEYNVLETHLEDFSEVNETQDNFTYETISTTNVSYISGNFNKFQNFSQLHHGISFNNIKLRILPSLQKYYISWIKQKSMNNSAIQILQIQRELISNNNSMSLITEIQVATNIDPIDSDYYVDGALNLHVFITSYDNSQIPLDDNPYSLFYYSNNTGDWENSIVMKSKTQINSAHFCDSKTTPELNALILQETATQMMTGDNSMLFLTQSNNLFSNILNIQFKLQGESAFVRDNQLFIKQSRKTQLQCILTNPLSQSQNYSLVLRLIAPDGLDLIENSNLSQEIPIIASSAQAILSWGFNLHTKSAGDLKIYLQDSSNEIIEEFGFSFLIQPTFVLISLDSLFILEIGIFILLYWLYWMKR